MNNEITIDIDQLLTVPDNSIDDYETIRQIGLLSCTRNDVPDETRRILNRKINSMFAYAGLYPTVMQPFDTKPKHTDMVKLFDKLKDKLKKDK